MSDLPKPINDLWLILAIIRNLEAIARPRRNARPIQGNAEAKPSLPWDSQVYLDDSQGISVIPIDWETMKDLIGMIEPHESKVNMCWCCKCGGAFGKAFAKYDAKGNTLCRHCAETPTITNDSDDTPQGAD